jgi:hypothetical protein
MMKKKKRINNKIKKKELINQIRNMIKECDYDNYQGEWKI